MKWLYVLSNRASINFDNSTPTVLTINGECIIPYPKVLDIDYVEYVKNPANNIQIKYKMGPAALYASYCHHIIYKKINDSDSYTWVGRLYEGDGDYAGVADSSAKVEAGYRPCQLIGLINGDYSITYGSVIELEDDILIGKYKLKHDNITSIQYNKFSFPLKCSFSGKTFEFIGDSCYYSPLSEWKDYTIVYGSPKDAYVFNQPSTTNSISGYYIPDEYSKAWYQNKFVTNGVVEDDGIIDFGLTPQHVPKFFKDWLIENSEEIILPMQLNLYKNSAEPNTLDKGGYLEPVGTLAGTLRNETSVTNVVMQIEYSKFPDFNYVYLAMFNRYYYVDDIISVRNNLWEIHLSVDVLMTYKDAIIKCVAYVDRTSAGVENKDIPDDRLVIIPGYSIIEFTIPNDIITSAGESGSYVLNGFLFTYNSINPESAQSDNSDIANATEDGGDTNEQQL